MTNKTPVDFKTAIQTSGFDIYSPIEVGDANYWIPTLQLEALLNQDLIGLNLNGLALRTRSKVVKQAVCSALGYPVPESFKKTQPRFFGQQLDIYTQKSRNLQIWNEELSPTRRYALIQISELDVVTRVRVVNGQELASLDTTGTITTKYQASLLNDVEANELISNTDTPELLPYLNANAAFSGAISPVDEPQSSALLPIQEIFSRLSPLVGCKFKDPGVDQERNRGEGLHRLICEYLGYSRYEDKGQFPDIRHQLLEVKLQTSPTIDLGLVLPSSNDNVDVQQLGNYHPKHRDTRYVIFYGNTDGTFVTLTNLYVTTGADFFSRFRRFEGRVSNGKIQVPLPRSFFGV
ncbi:MAG: restriction endonuclease [Methyloprofundus sp.]|nr:restriction endonuclease [Methyloprofundus sp.]